MKTENDTLWKLYARANARPDRRQAENIRLFASAFTWATTPAFVLAYEYLSQLPYMPPFVLWTWSISAGMLSGLGIFFTLYSWDSLLDWVGGLNPFYPIWYGIWLIKRKRRFKPSKPECVSEIISYLASEVKKPHESTLSQIMATRDTVAKQRTLLEKHVRQAVAPNDKLAEIRTEHAQRCLEALESIVTRLAEQEQECRDELRKVTAHSDELRHDVAALQELSDIAQSSGVAIQSAQETELIEEKLVRLAYLSQDAIQTIRSIGDECQSRVAAGTELAFDPDSKQVIGRLQLR